MTSVYIDISKAFDKVNKFALYQKLIDRRLPSNLIHLFISWYSVSASIVCWRGVSSKQYELESGVRQGGGVISPVLFAMYINILIVKIQNSKLGCHINRVPMSIFMFADDLVLVASSLIHLRIMIEICQCELDEIDMKLNVGKTQCIVFGKHYLRVRPNLVINGSDISWSRTVTYLGVTFKSSSNLQVDVKNRRSKFYQSFNSILSRASKSGDIVLLSLLNSFCLPCLYYGLEPFDMNATTGNKLNVPLKRAFNKIFGVYDNITVNHCMYYCGLLPAPLEITFRKYKLLCKARNSLNLNMRLCSSLNEIAVDEILSRYGSGGPMSFSELRKQLFSSFFNTFAD